MTEKIGKFEKERRISDGELLAGGAHLESDGRITPTEEQQEKLKKEHEISVLAKRMDKLKRQKEELSKEIRGIAEKIYQIGGIHFLDYIEGHEVGSYFIDRLCSIVEDEIRKNNYPYVVGMLDDLVEVFTEFFPEEVLEGRFEIKIRGRIHEVLFDGVPTMEYNDEYRRAEFEYDGMRRMLATLVEESVDCNR